MLTRRADPIEIGSLIVIVVALLWGGRQLLATLHNFPLAALGMLGIGIVGLCVSIAKVYRSGIAQRLELTRRIAYLCGLVLACWAVVAPVRWVIGSTLAMLVMAIAFDVVTRFVPEVKT